MRARSFTFCKSSGRGISFDRTRRWLEPFVDVVLDLEAKLDGSFQVSHVDSFVRFGGVVIKCVIDPPPESVSCRVSGYLVDERDTVLWGFHSGHGAQGHGQGSTRAAGTSHDVQGLKPDT